MKDYNDVLLKRIVDLAQGMVKPLEQKKSDAEDQLDHIESTEQAQE